MADKKTELMAQFYAECQRKGYIDMTDDIQSLKAKVIATDFKLNYGNIVSFYEKAKNSYEQVQKEKAEDERLRAIRQQKEAQEEARRQVKGELLVTLSDRADDSDDTTSVRVYIRPDNSVYCTFNNGSKIEGVPKISIKQGGALLLTYHPSQAVYTGATVGGITTGGVHYTQSGYTASKTYSGKGDIEISVGGRSFTLRLVKMSGHTCNLFKRDGQFTSLVHNREIECYLESDTANFYYKSIKTGRLDYQTMMNALSMAADEQRLSYAMCERIINLLGRIVHGQFPPSDEQIYDSAKALENASTSAELNRAIELYTCISEYKDAAKRACDLREKYEEILQAEKEQAILEREARTKKNKRMAIILIPILAILIVAAVIISNSVQKSNDYEFALSLVESGQYEDAIEHFVALGDYKDSTEQLQAAKEAQIQAEQEKKKADAYAEAETLLERGRYAEACAAFIALGDYNDSKERLKESYYHQAVWLLGQGEDMAAYDSFLMAEDYGDAKEQLGKFQKMLVAVTYTDDDNNGYTTYYDYTADGKLSVYWSDEVRERMEYIYNSEGALTQVKEWNYNHLINGEPSYYLIHFDANGIPVKYDDTANNIIVEFTHVFAEDGSVQSITCQYAQYSGSNKTLFNKQSATFTFVDKIEKYYVDQYSTGNILNAFINDFAYKTYAIYVVNDTIGIYEVGSAELDEHGSFIKYSERGGIFNADGGWVNEFEYTNTYDENGNISAVVCVNVDNGKEAHFLYNYGYIYVPEGS